MPDKTSCLYIGFLLIGIAGLLTFDASAQIKDKDPNAYIKELVEAIAENLPDDYDLFELTERLNFYHKTPISLNNTNPEELGNLIFLSPLQISNFFAHIGKNGKLIELWELQAIEGFDALTIERLLPFVKITSAGELSQLKATSLLTKSNSDLIIRYSQLLERRKGFRELPGSRYLGSPEKLLLRFKYQYSDLITASVVMEKDPGEYLLHGKTKADHLSSNVSFSKLGRLKKLVVGDYSLQFGQGLTLWSGFSFGKGPDVTSVAARDGGLRAYTSANETSFFRGIASTLSLSGRLALSTFFSSRNLDASLSKQPDGSTTLSNISTSGLHRTATELRNKGSLHQQLYGGTLQYTSDSFTMGLIGYHSKYSRSFVTGSQPYNAYSFTGRRLTNVGLHYNYTFENIYFYGETAHSVNSGWAIVHGAMTTLSPQLSAVLVHRRYSRDHHNFFSSGMGEGGETANEEGLYIGINYSPARRWMLSVYGDYFKFPWLKYRIDSPSGGYEILSQLTFTPKKTLKALIRYKREQKQQNPDADSENTSLEQVCKQSLRLDCNWQISKHVSFQDRAEASYYRKGASEAEYGYLVYHDVSFSPSSSRISGNLRIAYFHTGSYNTRLYAYEDDVLYGASSGLYYGKGMRTFFNARYRVSKPIDIWVRYDLYLYQGQDKISSGLDEITGNKKSEMKCQIRYQF